MLVRSNGLRSGLAEGRRREPKYRRVVRSPRESQEKKISGEL